MTSIKGSDTRRCPHLLSACAKVAVELLNMIRKTVQKKKKKEVEGFHGIIFSDVFSACMTQPFSYPSLALSSS